LLVICYLLTYEDTELLAREYNTGTVGPWDWYTVVFCYDNAQVDDRELITLTIRL